MVCGAPGGGCAPLDGSDLGHVVVVVVVVVVVSCRLSSCWSCLVLLVLRIVGALRTQRRRKSKVEVGERLELG